jgi:hypothetical protein
VTGNAGAGTLKEQRLRRMFVTLTSCTLPDAWRDPVRDFSIVGIFLNRKNIIVS